MAILCMAYFIAVGAVLGGAAALLDRSMAARSPRRWIWLAAIVLSIALPILTAFYRPSTSLSVLGRHVAPVPGMGGAAATWYAGLGGAWVHCDAPTALLFMKLSWAAAALFLLWGVGGALRATWLVRREGGGRRLELVDGARVIVTESLGPATIGIVRARVLVPRWVLALPPARRRYVIRHEEEHRRAHDAALLALAALLVCLMPWNLALWGQLRRLRLAVELDCDHRVVATLGDPRAYGELLLRVAEAASRAPSLQPALAGRGGMLERRLRAIVAPAPLAGMRRHLALALAAALVAALLTVPHPLPPAGARPAPGGTAAHVAH